MLNFDDNKDQSVPHLLLPCEEILDPLSNINFGSITIGSLHVTKSHLIQQIEGVVINISIVHSKKASLDANSITYSLWLHDNEGIMNIEIIAPKLDPTNAKALLSLLTVENITIGDKIKCASSYVKPLNSTSLSEPIVFFVSKLKMIIDFRNDTTASVGLTNTYFECNILDFYTKLHLSIEHMETKNYFSTIKKTKSLDLKDVTYVTKTVLITTIENISKVTTYKNNCEACKVILKDRTDTICLILWNDQCKWVTKWYTNMTLILLNSLKKTYNNEIQLSVINSTFISAINENKKSKFSSTLTTKYLPKLRQTTVDAFLNLNKSGLSNTKENNEISMKSQKEVSSKNCDAEVPIVKSKYFL